MKKCSKTVSELFGVDITNDRQFKVEKRILKDKETGKAFPLYFYSPTSTLHDKKDFGDLLAILPSSQKWKWDTGSAVYGHLEHHYSEMKHLIPVNLMEQRIKDVAKEIDRKLIKIGRDLTPANRMIYLRLGEYYSKYKINWHYADLGFTDASYISLFKSEKIRSKKMIRFWAEQKKRLPDKLFVNLIKAGISSEQEVEFWMDSKETLPEDMFNELLSTGSDLSDGRYQIF